MKAIVLFMVLLCSPAQARLQCAASESKMAHSQLLRAGECQSGYALSPYEGNVKCIAPGSSGLGEIIGNEWLKNPPSYGSTVAFCFAMNGRDVVLGDLQEATTCTSRVGYMCPNGRSARLNQVFAGSDWCTIDCD